MDIKTFIAISRTNISETKVSAVHVHSILKYGIIIFSNTFFFSVGVLCDGIVLICGTKDCSQLLTSALMSKPVYISQI